MNTSTPTKLAIYDGFAVNSLSEAKIHDGFAVNSLSEAKIHDGFAVNLAKRKFTNA